MMTASEMVDHERSGGRNLARLISLGEILTNLIQIWVCVVVYVTVDAAVQLIFSDKTMFRNGFLR